ncbi:hypothetical protein J3L11_11935 [Shewanella sp. 4t3-1-2LB]|uniref:hypothetical protein n=1 Tax=Shewanella sp. 4t3-1-2LB TaxID=2817682 RepID=UPI001A987018|nr:hypothetical protein [Shewanella sp. 4t3-1-2LB]MBO1272352.1 hypothetical protein [Shewanella sp. 4t3-1-2LB]
MILQIIIALLFITSCLIDARAREHLSSRQALDQIGRNVEIDMVIKHSEDRYADEGVIYLYDDNTNALSLALTAGAIAQLQEQGIVDPAGYFLNKKLTVAGAVMRLNERYLLPVQNADQLTLLK